MTVYYNCCCLQLWVCFRRYANQRVSYRQLLGLIYLQDPFEACRLFDSKKSRGCFAESARCPCVKNRSSTDCSQIDQVLIASQILPAKNSLGKFIAWSAVVHNLKYFSPLSPKRSNMARKSCSRRDTPARVQNEGSLWDISVSNSIWSSRRAAHTNIN